MDDKLFGYMTILHFMGVRDMIVQDPEDVADAIVELTMDDIHFTDEDLVEAVDDFYALQSFMNQVISAGS